MPRMAAEQVIDVHESFEYYSKVEAGKECSAVIYLQAASLLYDNPA